MKELNAKGIQIESASALETARQAQWAGGYPAYIGLDIHKETIAVAVARAGRDAPENRDEIANEIEITATNLLNRAVAILDYPPKGSPDYKPRADSADEHP